MLAMIYGTSLFTVEGKIRGRSYASLKSCHGFVVIESLRAASFFSIERGKRQQERLLVGVLNHIHLRSRVLFFPVRVF